MRLAFRLWLPRLALSTILLLTLIAYGQVIGFDFVDWDDTSLVLGNPLTQKFTPAVFWTFKPELYSPLSLLSFQIEHWLTGFEPALFHSTNLLLHLVNIFLVYRLVSALTGKNQHVDAAKDRDIPLSLGALFAAALFALHPVQVESVAWVSARKELLWTLFGLLALIAYTREPENGTPQHAVSRFLFRHRVFLFIVLALLSKPTAVVLPLILLLIDWNNGRLSYGTVKEKWPLFGIAIVFGLLGLLGKTGGSLTLTPWEHILLIPAGLVYASRLLLWPLHYTVLHPALTPIALLTPLYGGSLVFVCALGMLLWESRRRFPGVFLSAGIFFFALLPGLLSPLHADTVTLGSEHYLYFPLIGFAIALAAISSPPTPYVLSPVLGLFVLLTPLTFLQASVWRDSTTLFESIRNTYPRNAAVLTNLGAAYARMERYPAAESVLRQAIGLDPDLAQAHFNLAGLRYVRGDYPSAITEYKRVIALQENHVDAWRLLTWSYYRNGDLARAREAYDTTVHLRPTAREQLPDLRSGTGVAL